MARNGNGNGNGTRWKMTPVWDSMDMTRRLRRFNQRWDSQILTADKVLTKGIEDMDAAWKQHDPATKQLVHVKSD